MSERGVFAVDRGIWEHDLLLENEPFSRREAWLWLVSEAAWKAHRRRLTGKLIDLRRGQLAGSLRFIASKWRWSEPKVRRFLGALKSEQMIDARSDAGVTVITICKYDEYQRVSLPDDADDKVALDAGATQERRKVEDKEDKEVTSLRSVTPAKAKRIDPGWKPSETENEFARMRGLTARDTDVEAEKFRNYWTAKGGREAAKLDWAATWRNWILNAVERRPAGGINSIPRPGSKEDMRERSADAYRKLSDYVDANAHDEGRSSSSREANAGLIPFVKPARS